MPREEFNVDDGDILLLFLSGRRKFFSVPSNDPWFSAHSPYTLTGTNETGYLMDHLLSPLGCIERVRATHPLHAFR